VNNSVARALRMLELVADNDGAPMRLSALAAAINAPKSSAHSILRSLLASRFLELTQDGGYGLGIRAFEVGAAYSRHMSPTRAVHVELVNLSHELRVTAVGKAALAYADETALGRADLNIRGNSSQQLTRSSLDHELAQVRRDGYAVDEGDTAAGICCVAAPVFDARQQCCGAVGVSYLSSAGLSIETVARQVRAAAHRTSKRLGAPGAAA
jgi:DNA-binding IclR family transcriptional regulator